MHNYFYFNHADKFLDINKSLWDKLVEFQKTEPCRANKEALEYCLMTVIGS